MRRNFNNGEKKADLSMRFIVHERLQIYQRNTTEAE